MVDFEGVFVVSVLITLNGRVYSRCVILTCMCNFGNFFFFTYIHIDILNVHTKP